MEADDAVPELVVRRVRSGEWKQYRELRLRALANDPMAFGSTLLREQGYPDEKWQEYCRSGSAAENSSTWIATTIDDQWVGMCVCAEHEGDLHLFAMWVDPEYRGRKAGGSLLDATLRWVDERFPERKVILQVNPTQAAALKLYLSRGFRANGEQEPIGHTPGVLVDTMVRAPRGAMPPG